MKYSILAIQNYQQMALKFQTTKKIKPYSYCQRSDYNNAEKEKWDP